ncbi:hypothetical protein AB0L88_41015 [Saccharopolyspora shandongensis]|uniref:Uncharacterized protein n=1 Tax=Saccharopolyspora shandongensis TaxID=418495 RepID=A0A1H3HFH0_9PSEU|nr:hypothetical protein [Saccharopolyspora shandongensis]SDY13409.1 hypothetical protein SAMN05216215_1020105 [Saccharopolyspora shandongensis]
MCTGSGRKADDDGEDPARQGFVVVSAGVNGINATGCHLLDDRSAGALLTGRQRLPDVVRAEFARPR